MRHATTRSCLTNAGILLIAGISLAACGSSGTLNVPAAGTKTASTGSDTSPATTATPATPASTATTGTTATPGSAVTVGTGNTADPDGLLSTVADTTTSLGGRALDASGGSLVSSSDLLSTVSNGFPDGVNTLANRPANEITSLGNAMSGMGNTTGSDGVSSIPVAGSVVGSVVTGGDTTLGPLANVSVLNAQPAGSDSTLVDASVLSPGAASGGMINANALANHQVLAVTMPGASSASSGSSASTVTGLITPAGQVVSGLATPTTASSATGGIVATTVATTTAGTTTAVTRSNGLVSAVTTPVTAGLTGVLRR